MLLHVHSGSRAVLLIGLVFAGMAWLATPAPAAAERPVRAAWKLHRALEGAVACRSPLPLAPGRRCRGLPAPVSTGTLLEDALALAYGEVEGVPLRAPHRLRDQYRCQRTIARSVARFTGLGLVLRELGWRSPERTRWTHRIFDALERDCDVEARRAADGVRIPSVGPQCAAAIAPAGEPVDVAALRSCFETLLPVWIERASASAEPLRPNILLVLTDDQRWDTVDARHSPDGEPALPMVTDLVRSGLAFENAYVTTPVCCPSRVSIETGQYVSSHGVLRNTGEAGGALAFDDASTVATWLRDAGYRTGFFGKYLNGYRDLWISKGGPYVPPGWDDWRAFDSNGGGTYLDYRMIENGTVVAYGAEDEDYSTDVLRDHTLDFVDRSVAERAPFFAFVSPSAPHAPYVPAPRHLDSFAGIPFFEVPSSFEEDVSDKPTWVRNLPPGNLFRFLGAHGVRVRQLEMLRAVDDLVGALLQRLDEHGIAEDTLVAFFSDNGFSWGEHRWVGKACPYEECLRVPLVVRYPRLVPLPRSEASFALGIDLAPTFAALAGAVLPPGRDGRSLVRVLDGTDRAPVDAFFFEAWSGAQHTYLGVRERGWKFLEYANGERELYDLEADPYELDNLAGSAAQAGRVGSLRDRLAGFRPLWPFDAF